MFLPCRVRGSPSKLCKDLLDVLIFELKTIFPASSRSIHMFCSNKYKVSLNEIIKAVKAMRRN